MFLDESYPFNERGTQPTKERILDRLHYYRNTARALMKMEPCKEQVEKATILRHELVDEYSRLDLSRVSALYKTNPFFFGYRKTLVSGNKTTGRLTLKNTHSFLYDVQDYCGYEIATIEKTGKGSD